MRDIQVRLAALLLATVAVPAGVWAQAPPDPADTARVQAGPFSINPRFELLNVGVDSNVFDEEDGARQDFTATLRPGLDATMRIGRGRVMYRGSLEAVYFRKYADERSLNRFGEVRAEARLTRFVPYAMVSGLATRERPNREIDQRARRTNQTLGAGAALMMWSRTSLVAGITRQIVKYGATEAFRGENLSRRLDETRTSVNGGLRFALTPLTTFSLTATRELDRFDLSPDRDADSLRIVPAFEFDPSALIGGTVSVGYRRFRPLHDTMVPFSGVVAQVMTRCTLFGRTRLELQGVRDVEYSYRAGEPYYLRTGGTFTVTQLLAGPIDVQGVAGRDRLEYRSTEPDGNGDRDTIDVGGGGVGYRFAQTARLGVNVEYSRRRSPVSTRSFDRRRIFGSVTYGF